MTKKNLTILLALFLMVNTAVFAQIQSVSRMQNSKGAGVSVTLGDTVYVFGGIENTINGLDYTTKIDIFTRSSQQWRTRQLPIKRLYSNAIVSGQKILLCGAPYLMETYDPSNNSVKIDTLPVFRSEYATIKVGNKIYHAGGYLPNNTSAQSIDVFDPTNRTWQSISMPTGRAFMGAAMSGSKVFFAGGLDVSNGAISNVVSIYDTLSRTWTTAQLSEPRYIVKVVAVGNKVVFFGGTRAIGGFAGYRAYFDSKKIDIYDTSTNTWTVTESPIPLTPGAAIAAQGKAYFAGGSSWSPNAYQAFGDTIYIYNPQNNTFNKSYKLSVKRESIAVAEVGDSILFSGGILEATVNTVLQRIPQFVVDVLRLSGNVAVKDMAETQTLSVYPNPVTENFAIQIETNKAQKAVFDLLNTEGQLVRRIEKEVSNGKNQIDFDRGDLPTGLYVLRCLLMEQHLFHVTKVLIE